MSIPENPMAPAVAMPGRALLAARPRPAGPTGSALTTPADIWRIIRRRLLLVIIVFLIVIVVGVSLTYVWWKWWPSWEGLAMLEVKYPIVPEALEQRQLPPANVVELFQRNEARVIRSRQHINELLGQDVIQETQWFKKKPAKALERFEKTLAVDAIRDSALIQIRFRTRDREEAPRIVNELVAIYMHAQQEQAADELDLQLRGLRLQHQTLSSELLRVTSDITEFVRLKNIPVITMRYTEVDATLARLAVILSDVKLAHAAAVGALDVMRLQDPATWVPGSMQSYQIENDPPIRTLRAYLLNLQEEREAQSKRLGPGHIFLKRLDERIRIADRDLQTKLDEARLRVFRETLQDYDSRVTSNELTLEQIQDGINQEQKKQRALYPDILDYQSKVERKAALTEFLGDVDKKIKSTEATVRLHIQLRGGQVVLRAGAVRAPKPASPNIMVNIPATIVLGMIIGLGLAFMLEYLDKSLRSSQDIRRHTSLTFLGSIPALQEDEANPQDMYSVVTNAPRSLLAEAFRQVRTNILFASGRETCRSILVTSPSPEDGRTCISVNLAASFALSGKKVLLIDANFRKPAFLRLFTNLPPMGFAELLSGKASSEQTIASSDAPGLSVMGSGQPPAHHAELLGSATIKSVIEKLSEQFDHVIIYGPPALLSADALAMAGQVEAVLFVARAGKNSRGEVNRMRQEISTLNSHILGVVLNGVQATSGGYLRKSYQRFYDYQLSSTEQEAVQTTSDSQQQGPSPPEHS